MNINIYATYLHLSYLFKCVDRPSGDRFLARGCFLFQIRAADGDENRGIWTRSLDLGDAPPTGLIYSRRDIKATDEKPVQVHSVIALSCVAVHRQRRAFHRDAKSSIPEFP